MFQCYAGWWRYRWWWKWSPSLLEWLSLTFSYILLESSRSLCSPNVSRPTLHQFEQLKQSWNWYRLNFIGFKIYLCEAFWAPGFLWMNHLFYWTWTIPRFPVLNNFTDFISPLCQLSVDSVFLNGKSQCICINPPFLLKLLVVIWWLVIFRKYLGAWPTFWLSLLYIGLLVLVVEQVCFLVSLSLSCSLAMSCWFLCLLKVKIKHTVLLHFSPS